MNILIDGTQIKSPNNPKYPKRSRFELSKGGRTADGTMTKDRIARKRKWFFLYDIITGVDLQVIVDLIYNSDETFFEMSLEDHNGAEVHTVYVGEISESFFRKGGLHGWYYTNFSFNLIEQ